MSATGASNSIVSRPLISTAAVQLPTTTIVSSRPSIKPIEWIASLLQRYEDQVSQILQFSWNIPKSFLVLVYLISILVTDAHRCSDEQSGSRSSAQCTCMHRQRFEAAFGTGNRRSRQSAQSCQQQCR